jgi:hypothetical protein
MRGMILKLLIILAICGGIYWQRQTLLDLVYKSPCDTPISYKIGDVDPKFNLTQSQFEKDINMAADIWRKVEGKTLFEYQPEGILTISMVYDQRQELESQINNLDSQLNQQKKTLSPKLDEFNKLTKDFQARVTDLNNRIDFWNSRGGAPPEIYDQLKKEQQGLQIQSEKLKQMAQELNQSTNTFNSGVGQLKQTVNNFNEAISDKPEAGLYNGSDDTITIYFNEGQTGIVHTVAHELGHAIGMMHVADTGAIMHAQSNNTIVPTTQDSDEIHNACRKRIIIFGRVLYNPMDGNKEIKK